VGWSTPRSARFTPGKETRCPLYRRLGGPQGRSGRMRKIWPPPGFDPRTVQPVASRCTDWAIAAPVLYFYFSNSLSFSIFLDWKRVIIYCIFSGAIDREELGCVCSAEFGCLRIASSVGIFWTLGTMKGGELFYYLSNEQLLKDSGGRA